MRFLAGVFALISVVTASAPAHADEAAQQFVAENGALAISILRDDSLTVQDKKHQFRTLVERVVDVPRVTNFVLGQYANVARNRAYDTQDALDADIEEFSEVFKDYAIGVYEARLGDYGGETFEVMGSTNRREDDFIVHTLVSGGNQDQPLEVNWRVLERGGEFRVVDVEVYDVWLAINQREEIVGIIREAQGDIDAATRALAELVTKREGESL